AVFTRAGGSSRGALASLNVCASVGDEAPRVRVNRDAVARCMGMERLVLARQVHGAGVLVLTADEEAGWMDPGGGPPEGDALVTDLPDRLLVIQTADCQPILLFDPVRRVVANIHSGWRGSVANIVGETLRVMADRLGCRADRVIAGLGPSLGPCCAEFIHYRSEIPERLWRYKDRADHFDFWAMSRDQLLQGGVAPENIHLSRICTRCESDRFFSYRSNHATGRFATVIGLE
ncbi:MAG: peptidoglycan editing factor PgeF, partial [Desulfobacterales bacterium]|nr:peptidoglycan editing factor PgeF [Desulfobacterales bacterium]